MGNNFFNEYPYTDFHELNLSWVIKELRSFATTLEQFVSINALKYADPIQWDITRQYEKNTIVIDPQSGTAYLSVQAVPSGVALTNEDYWTVVFNLEQFVTKTNNNLTVRVEESATLNATFATPINHWVIWNSVLYRAIANIIPGDQYVIGSNIIEFTVEDVAGHIQDLITANKTNLVAAINEVLTTLNNTTGNLANLNTTDKNNLVAAINEVLTALNTAIDGIDSDINAINSAINTINSAINAINALFPLAPASISDSVLKKHCVFIGDSFTSSAAYPDPEHNWAEIVSKRLGATCHNYSISGAGYNDVGYGTFLSEVNTAVADGSYDHRLVTDIFVYGGINDTNHNTINSIINALDTVLTALSNEFTNATIHVMFNGTYQVVYPTAATGDLFISYNISKYCIEHGYHFLDVTLFFMGTRGTLISNDSIHPTNLGQLELAAAVLSMLKGGQWYHYIVDHSLTNYILTQDGVDTAPTVNNSIINIYPGGYDIAFSLTYNKGTNFSANNFSLNPVSFNMNAFVCKSNNVRILAGGNGAKTYPIYSVAANLSINCYTPNADMASSGLLGIMGSISAGTVYNA